MSADSQDLLLTQDGYVATITINRPEKGNTWQPAMTGRLEQLMRQCGEDDTVRVIVLTGAGKHFCTGGDLDFLKSIDGTNFPRIPRARTDDNLSQRYSYMMSIPKPIIGALNGACFGLGLAISLYCDIRYASDKAKLAVMFSRRGLVAEHGIAWLMPRLMGLSRAFNLIVGGHTISATEALQAGLVDAVFPHETFREEVARHAADIAQNVSPRCARIMKRQIYESMHMTLAQATHIAEDETPGCFASEDFKEGIASAVERRQPMYTGR